MKLTAVEKNLLAWQTHYQRDRSRQNFPDENVVRYFSRWARERYNKESYVLDLGCGGGRNLQFIRSIFPNTFGVDFSLNALKTQEDVICANMHHLPFPDNSFDVILSWGVYHYLNADLIDSAMQESFRVLKPQGRIIASLRSDKDTHLNKTTKQGDLKNGLATFFSEEQAKKIFLKNGFHSVVSGFVSRRPLGEQELIAHHLIEAVRK